MAKHRLTTVGLLLISIIGLALLLYPTLSNMYNMRHTSRLIASYVDQVAELDDDQYAQILLDAQNFNARLRDMHGYELSSELEEEYLKQLDVSGVGIMGYVDIPKIDVSLPIYHGTSAGVLQVAVGHLEWSSLPVGGAGTHCVISGHRGLPNAKLFTDLPKLEIGDAFYIRVLNELLTYQIDQILTVEPSEMDELKVVEGKDYFSLVTCTPYGINSHRLLVRGHRISTAEQAREIIVTADAGRVESLVVAPFFAMPILLLLLIIVFVNGGKSQDDE